MAVTNEEVFNWLQSNPTATDAEIAQAAAAAGVSAEQLSQVTGVPVAQVEARVAAAAPTVQLPPAVASVAPAPAPTLFSAPTPAPTFSPAPVVAPAPTPVTNEQVFNWLQSNSAATDAQIVQAAAAAGVSAQQLSEVTGVPVEQVIERATIAAPEVQLPVAPAPTLFSAPAPAPTPVENTWNYDEYQKALRTGGDLGEQVQRLATQNPDLAAAAGNLYGEIIAQQNAGSAEFWYKGNTASKEAAAADFALRLAENGITSLNQLGQGTVDGGFDEGGNPIAQQVTINKVTGQPLPRPELLGRGTRGLDIDYNLAFTENGQVIPYTSNRESSWMSFRENALKPAAAFALTAFGAPMIGAAVAPGLAAATQGAIGGALAGAGSAALTGGDILKGAVLGGAGGYFQGANAAPAAATDASFLAADAAQLAAQGLSESAITQVLAAPGYVSAPAASLAASMAVNGLDVGTITQQLDALSSNTGLMSQTLSDATFIAEDASRLAAQGLSEPAIKEVLSAPGYVSDSAANLAASMAANGLDAVTMAQQLDALSTNTGLMSQTGSAADFAAADALQLQNQVGNNFAAIEQNLIASGVDPLIAADISQQIAFNPGLTQTDLATNLANSFGNNIYDVNMATTYPTSTLPGSGGLLSDVTNINEGLTDADFLAADALQLQAQVGNNAAAIEQNLVASGVDPLVAADVSNQVILNPGITQAELAANLGGSFGTNIFDVNTAATYPTSVLPGSGGLLSDLPATTTPNTTPATTPPASSTGLTNSQIANLIKAGVSLASITGAVNAAGGGGASTPMQTPTQGVPISDPNYYNQLQQYYNAYLPQTPRDVVSPLQQWYNSSYGA